MANADSLPTLDDPTGPCPRCARRPNFSTVNSTPLQSNGHQRAVILKCMGCQDSLVVVERWENGDFAGIHWWPTPGAGSLDPSVPGGVASAYDEGMRALAVAAPRAAAVMFRGALAEVVSDKGSAAAQAKGTLYEQLKVMDFEGTLHPSLTEWAKEIRVLGNVGAHPSSLDTVTVANAADLGHLVTQMINVLYETPARIARSRAARTPTP